MRALILWISVVSFAQTEISWVRKGKYKSEWNKIYQKESKWLCDTELQSRFPFGATGVEALKELKKQKDSSSICEKSISVAGLAKAPRKFCLDARKIHEFFETLDKSCGR